MKIRIVFETLSTRDWRVDNCLNIQLTLVSQKSEAICPSYHIWYWFYFNLDGKRRKTCTYKNKKVIEKKCNRICLKEGESEKCDEIQLTCTFNGCRCYKKINLQELRERERKEKKERPRKKEFWWNESKQQTIQDFFNEKKENESNLVVQFCCSSWWMWSMSFSASIRQN